MADILKLAVDKEPQKWRVLEGEHHLVVYIKTNMIFVRKQFRAERIPSLFKSTGFTTKNIMKARRMAEELITAHRIEHLGHDSSTLLNKRKIKPVSEVVDELLKRYTAQQRMGTQGQHEYYFGRIKDRFGDRDIHSLDVSDFEKWIEDLRKEPVLRKMRNGEVKKYPPRKTFWDFSKFMNILMNYARDRNMTKNLTVFSNPDTIHRAILEQKKREEDRSGKKYLTVEEREILELQSSRCMTRAEIDRLFEVLEGDLRDQFICGFTCIMRLRETIEAPWTEIDLNKGVWSLPAERVKTGSKTGEGRTFFLSPEALEVLRRRFNEQQGKSKFIFPGYTQTGEKVDKPVNSNKSAWSSAKNRAGITKRLRWHDIRHTALTFAILGDPDATPEQNKAMTQDPFKVAKFAGVSLKTIETVYLHTKPEQTQEVSRALAFTPHSHQIHTKITKNGKPGQI